MSVFRQNGIELVRGRIVPEKPGYYVLPEEESHLVVLRLCAVEPQPLWKLANALGNIGGKASERSRLILKDLAEKDYLEIISVQRPKSYRHKWHHLTETGRNYLQQLEKRAALRQAEKLAATLIQSFVPTVPPVVEAAPVLATQPETTPQKRSRCACGTFKKQLETVCKKCVRRREKDTGPKSGLPTPAGVV